MARLSNSNKDFIERFVVVGGIIFWISLQVRVDRQVDRHGDASMLLTTMKVGSPTVQR